MLKEVEDVFLPWLLDGVVADADNHGAARACPTRASDGNKGRGVRTSAHYGKTHTRRDCLVSTHFGLIDPTAAFPQFFL